MKDSSAAPIYAKALYLALKDVGNAELASADFAVLSQQIISNQDFWKFLLNESVSIEKKESILKVFFKEAQLDSIISANFLLLLMRKKRLALLPLISQQVQRLSFDGAGKAKATVYSAFTLNADQIKKIEKTVSVFLNKTIETENIVQQDLLAGTIVQVGDFVMDNSLKSKLKKLKDHLTAQ